MISWAHISKSKSKMYVWESWGEKGSTLAITISTQFACIYLEPNGVATLYLNVMRCAIGCISAFQNRHKNSNQSASRFLCLHNNSTAYDALLYENVKQGHFLSQLWFNIEEWNCILERTIWLSKSHFLEGSVRLIFLEIQIFLYPSELLCKCTNF